MKNKFNINRIVAVYLLFICLEAGNAYAIDPIIFSEVSVSRQDPAVVVSGVVIDESEEPVPGASIRIAETDIITMTDGKGYFTMEVSTSAKELVVTCIGKVTRVVPIDMGKDMVIKMIADVHLKDQVLILAQRQETTREALTGAISIVNGDKLMKTASGGFSTRLAGRLSGLSIIQSSSEPGADGCTFFVRGRRSLNGNDPLIVLDGVPSPTTDINMLDPHLIESVILLKDASATAVYGFQAANGAILINTKRGTSGRTRISASADFSVQQATVKPQLAHSWEYAALRNEALYNDGTDLLFTSEDIQSYKSGDNRGLYPDNNWYDMFVRDFAPMQRYNINASGGNDRVRYFVNGSYMHQNGLIKTEKNEKYNPEYKLERYNLAGNMDVSLLSNLSAFLNSNIIIDRQNTPAQGDIWGTIFRTPAVVDGPLTPNGEVIATSYEPNPVYGRLNRSGYAKETRSTVNVSFGMKWGLDFITKGLMLKGTMGYESRYVGRVSGTRDYVRFIRDENESVAEPIFKPYGSWVNTPLSLGKSSNFRYYMNLLTTLAYDRTFDKKHEINASVGYFNQNYVKDSGDRQHMLPYDRIGLSGHAKYGFDHKYYIQMDAGYTGSEQFAKGNRFGFFPTLSAAWIISNESFMKKSQISNWLTFLKLRASYGLVGNDILPDRRFMYLDEFNDAGGGYIHSIYGGAIISEGLMGNPSIQWETSTQQNYGFDLGLINSLTLRFDYFYQKTKDIVLQSALIPDLQGISRGNMPYMNRGVVENKGFELELVYEKSLTKDLSVSASANIASNENKVINADELNKSAAGYYYPYRSTGFSIGQSWGHLIDYSNGNGYFNSQDEIDRSGLKYEGIAPRVGDFIYKDLNKDGIINDQDLAPIGYSDIPKISYGMDVQIGYKNFDFYIQLQGAAKRSVYTSGIGATETDGRGVYMDIHKNAWTEERYANKESISYPALSTTGSSSLRSNDFFITDRNYMRIKNIEIGYTLPASISRSAKLEKARFYVSGTNLLTFDSMKFDALDPEANNLSSYPVYRTFNIGLSLTF